MNCPDLYLLVYTRRIMKTTAYIFALAFITTFILPLSASAYETTGQRAQKINETTALYFIDFSFGHEDHDTYIPVLAVRDQEHGSKLKSLGYEILEESEEETDRGVTQAIVFKKNENVTIENGMYKVPKGYKGSFTLAVVYTTDNALFEADYAVQVTDLPFYWDTDKKYQRLNESELKYYITPEVELNSDNPGEMTIKVNVKDIVYTVRN